MSVIERAEPLIAERAKLRTWTPLVLLVLAWVVLGSNWGVVKSDWDPGTGSADTFGWTLELGRNVTTTTPRGLDIENATGAVIIDLDDSYENGYRDLRLAPANDNDGDGEDLADKLAKQADMISTSTGWLVPLGILLLAGVVDRTRPGGLSDRWPRVLNGLMAAAALGMMLAAFVTLLHIGGLGDGVIELLDLDAERTSGTLYGSAAQEINIGGAVHDEIASWRPGAMSWWTLLLLVVAGGLAATHLIEFHPGIRDIPATPSWPTSRDDIALFGGFGSLDLATAERAPDRVQNLLAWSVPFTLVVALLLVIVGLWGPWLIIDQTFHLNNDEDPFLEPYVFEWRVDPWEVQHWNHSVLAEENRTDSTEERLDHTYDSDTDLDLVTDVLDGLRWPLVIAVVLLVLALLVAQPWFDLLGPLGGDRRGWWVMCLAAVWLTLAFGLGSAGEDLGTAIGGDLDDISPGDQVIFYGTSTLDTTTSGYELGFANLELETVVVETAWNDGIGHSAAVWARTIAGLGLLLAIGSAGTLARNERPYSTPPSSWDRSDPWVPFTTWDRPAAWGVTAIVFLLMIVGSGVGDLLLGGGGDALPQRAWRVRFVDDSAAEQTQQTVADGGTVSWVANTNTMIASNLTHVDVRVTCDDGQQDFPTDGQDRFDVEIVPPEGFVAGAGSQPLTATAVACQGTWQSLVAAAHAPESPQDVRASSKSDAERRFTNHSAHGIWTVRVTATTADGGITGLFGDPSLDVVIELEAEGYTPEAERTLAEE